MHIEITRETSELYVNQKINDSGVIVAITLIDPFIDCENIIYYLIKHAVLSGRMVMVL